MSRPGDSLDELLARATPEAAALLIGWRLASDVGGEPTLGRIVETEAYLSADDGASHSANGLTARNASMFERAGTAYVYLIYGMHHCVNVVTAPRGCGEAILVRALEPLVGLASMRARRGERVTDRDLCRGPGRLCQALGIDLALDGHDLARAPLRLLPPEDEGLDAILASPRVGITKSADLPLRFREADSRWTS